MNNAKDRQSKPANKSYQEKKQFFDSLLTLYGRNVVYEILQDDSLNIYKLHLSSSNREEGIVRQIIATAKQRQIEIAWHDKKSLSRISKNGRQDQGVAIDIVTPNLVNEADFIDSLGEQYRILALDGVQNPQNLGMIIRSAAAGFFDAIVLPRHNSAKLSPLVMKASAGTMFKLPIVYCRHLNNLLSLLKGARIYALSSHASESIYDIKHFDKSVYVLGNENTGVSAEVSDCCTHSLKIPMHRGVESLNVSMTAAILSFLK
jgi:23S rRNA (guanosine2251-2'-O)-methyltransferase